MKLENLNYQNKKIYLDLLNTILSRKDLIDKILKNTDKAFIDKFDFKELSDLELVDLFSKHKTFYFNDGKYIGEQIDNIPNGKGAIYYKTGDKYLGNWKDGCYHGQGTLFYKNGKKCYNGKWKNDDADGKGILYYEDGKIAYEGLFDYDYFI